MDGIPAVAARVRNARADDDEIQLGAVHAQLLTQEFGGSCGVQQSDATFAHRITFFPGQLLGNGAIDHARFHGDPLRQGELHAILPRQPQQVQFSTRQIVEDRLQPAAARPAIRPVASAPVISQPPVGASQSSISPAAKVPGRSRSISSSVSPAKASPPAVEIASSIGRGP